MDRGTMEAAAKVCEEHKNMKAGRCFGNADYEAGFNACADLCAHAIRARCQSAVPQERKSGHSRLVHDKTTRTIVQQNAALLVSPSLAAGVPTARTGAEVAAPLVLPPYPTMYDGIGEQTDEDGTLVARPDYDALRAVAKEAINKLDDANYWRKRHSDHAVAADARSNENWSKWKAAEAQVAALTESLRDLLGFARRRLATGFIPPQGARAMLLLAKYGDDECATLVEGNREVLENAARSGKEGT